jgi:predicted ATP-grasp superfamily ATP-dependent carboligase
MPGEIISLSERMESLSAVPGRSGACGFGNWPVGLRKFGFVNQVGAIILGVEYQALGLLRQLRSAGIPCVLVDEDAWGPARFSKWRCPFFQCPPYVDDAFWPWLVRLQQDRALRGWVLIPTHDEQVHQIALHYAEAQRRFRYAGPQWDVYRLIFDKRLSYEWSRHHGINSPVSYLPCGPEDLPNGTLDFPFIVKPSIKRNFKRCSNAKAIPVESSQALRNLLQGQLAAVSTDELLYQEIIPGGGRQQWSYAGLFVRGQPVAAFTACRQRQHPPDFGRASTYVAAEHDAEVERESRKVLEALQYTGLAEVEWKRDPRNGQLKFLEVNARCWGWHSLASAVVGDLAPLLYQFLVHGETKPVIPHYGARWIKHITDVPVVVDLWRRGDVSLREYLRTLRGKVVGCEWYAGDPFPFFLQFLLLPYLLKSRGY